MQRPWTTGTAMREGTTARLRAALAAIAVCALAAGCGAAGATPASELTGTTSGPTGPRTIEALADPVRPLATPTPTLPATVTSADGVEVTVTDAGADPARLGW